VLPRLITGAQLQAELPAVLEWQARAGGWDIEVDAAELVVRVTTTHPAEGVELVVTGNCWGYPSVPPAWRFLDAAGASPKSAFPAPGSVPGITGSIFHGNGLICAPWNRLAYRELGGVHDDWGSIVNWRTAARGYTQAHTIADMLQTMSVHVVASPGMMT
jgi:hypothetical protein